MLCEPRESLSLEYLTSNQPTMATVLTRSYLFRSVLPFPERQLFCSNKTHRQCMHSKGVDNGDYL